MYGTYVQWNHYVCIILYCCRTCYLYNMVSIKHCFYNLLPKGAGVGLVQVYGFVGSMHYSFIFTSTMKLCQRQCLFLDFNVYFVLSVMVSLVLLYVPL